MSLIRVHPWFKKPSVELRVVLSAGCGVGNLKVHEQIRAIFAGPASDPETEAAWKAEIARRIEDIQTGKVQGIPGEEISARVGLIVGR